MKRSPSKAASQKFLKRPRRALSKKRLVILNILLFCGFAIFFFSSIMLWANWPAVKQEITYQEPSATATPTSSATPVVSPTPITTPNRLVIEKIKVDAPLSWDISPEETSTYLNKGVTHLKGTARAGEVGNFFVLGHSSDYIWKRNPYAAVFSLLPKLKAGDTIRVFDADQEYVYTVSGSEVISPFQVEVANPTKTATMTLLTCYPIGTTQKRLAVYADLVSPAPRQAVIDGVPQVSGIKFR